VHVPRATEDATNFLQALNQAIGVRLRPTVAGGDFNTGQQRAEGLVEHVAFMNNPDTRTTTNARRLGAIDHLSASPVINCRSRGVEELQVPNDQAYDGMPNHHMGFKPAAQDLFDIDVDQTGEDGLNEVPFGAFAEDDYTEIDQDDDVNDDVTDDQD
jgi:hypothetical protein